MKKIVGMLLAALVFLTPLSAEVVTNEKVPLSFGVFVPCAAGGAGEIVLLSGNLHILTAVTIDANGGLHIKEHFQPQGISGAGLTTGDKYQATGVTQNTFYVASPTFPFTFTFVNNFKIIGRGPDNNFLAHENFHITVNANGVVTTVVDNFKVECK
jgi:hypothetical protein